MSRTANKPLAGSLDNLWAVDKESRLHFDALLDQVRSPRGVVGFVGAGISCACGLPGWEAYLRETAAHFGASAQVDPSLAAGDFESAADALIDVAARKGFENFLRLRFGAAAKVTLREPATLLPDVFRGPVITTNFDRVIEGAFKSRGVDLPTPISGTDPTSLATALYLCSRVLVKVHGDAQTGAYRVLTKDDYSHYYGSTNPAAFSKKSDLVAALSLLFASEPILFVGCSLRRDRTLNILGHVESRHRMSPPRFAVVETPSDEAQRIERRKDLSRLGISPIWYPAGRHEYVTHVLRGLIDEPPALAVSGGLVFPDGPITSPHSPITMGTTDPGPLALESSSAARHLFDRIAEGHFDGAPFVLPESFRRSGSPNQSRDDAKLHAELRILRSLEYVRPWEGGAWRPGKRAILTRTGESIVRRERPDIATDLRVRVTFDPDTVEKGAPVPRNIGGLKHYWLLIEVTSVPAGVNSVRFVYPEAQGYDDPPTVVKRPPFEDSFSTYGDWIMLIELDRPWGTEYLQVPLVENLRKSYGRAAKSGPVGAAVGYLAKH